MPKQFFNAQAFLQFPSISSMPISISSMPKHCFGIQAFLYCSSISAVPKTSLLLKHFFTIHKAHLQCLSISSMPQHCFNAQAYLQCNFLQRSIIYLLLNISSVHKNFFSVQAFPQCSRIFSVPKHIFNVQAYLQCPPRISSKSKPFFSAQISSILKHIFSA